MRLRRCIELALLVACSSYFALSASAQSFETTARLRLREGPSSQDDIIRVLAKHESVTQLDADSAAKGYIWVVAGQDSGWVFSRYLLPVEAPAAMDLIASAATASSGPLASCPVIGTAQSGSTDALSNSLKRRIPPAGPTKTLTFADFGRLQRDVEQAFGIDAHHQKLNLNSSERQALRSLAISSGTIGEADRVRVAAYIVAPAPHANTGESVNCGLHGVANNDFHITVAEHPNDTGFQGIVVEMIPQNRPDGWNLQVLNQLEQSQTEVLVVGQLFYDEKHLVNDDPSHPGSGQPQRFSLFEIHPVTEFMVCQSSAPCDPDSPNGWVSLRQQVP